MNALEALRQVQTGKGFSIRGKALVREHGRSIGIVHFVVEPWNLSVSSVANPRRTGQYMKGA